MNEDKEKSIELHANAESSSFVAALDLIITSSHPEWAAISSIALATVQPVLANVIAFAHKEKCKYTEREKINICKTINNVELIAKKRNYLTEEWLAEYFECIKNISDSKMQKLWGKILSGEINEPDSYSIRTMDTIRKISKEEAELFQKVIPYVFNGKDFYYIPKCKSIYKHDINHHDIVILKEAGLISYDNKTALSSSIKPKESQPINNKYKAIVLVNNTEDVLDIQLEAMPLTQVGNQLMKILNQNSNEEFFYDFAKELLKDNKYNLMMSIYDIESIDENGKLNYKLNSCKDITI